jgi:hypothetical protein
MKLLVIFFMLVSFAGRSQLVNLEGFYEHKTSDFNSIYSFSKDNFSLMEIGDLGNFYGKGKFRIKGNIIVLDFDTLNHKESLQWTLIPAKTDSLTVHSLTKRKLEIEYRIRDEVYLVAYKKRRRLK